jgi:hypothetical protein
MAFIISVACGPFHGTERDIPASFISYFRTARRLCFSGLGRRPSSIRSASVHSSRTEATASRARRIKARMRHFATSAQSSHARKAVTLAQGVIANGPSIARIMSATDTWDGCAASRCPPAGPRRLSSRPWSRSCVRIASRNLRGTSAAFASSVALVQSLAAFSSANTRVARTAYFARLVSNAWLPKSGMAAPDSYQSNGNPAVINIAFTHRRGACSFLAK